MTKFGRKIVESGRNFFTAPSGRIAQENREDCGGCRQTSRGFQYTYQKLRMIKALVLVLTFALTTSAIASDVPMLGTVVFRPKEIAAAAAPEAAEASPSAAEASLSATAGAIEIMNQVNSMRDGFHTQAQLVKFAALDALYQKTLDEINDYIAEQDAEREAAEAARLAKEAEEARIAAEKKAEAEAKAEAARKKRAARWAGLSDDEVGMLCRIVQAEAGDQPYEGRCLVANVILNRVMSSKFPDTIEGVIFSPGQFSPVSNGSYYSVKIDSTTKKAVKAVLNGRDESEGALYFLMKSASSVTWFDRALTWLFKVGDHDFYK